MKVLAPVFALFAVLAFTPALAREDCRFSPAVCGVRAAVFAISAYDPSASAVRVSARVLVTNRHVVADETRVTVTLPAGAKVEGRVVPASYEGDLILIEADLGEGPVMKADEDGSGGPFHAIGFDFSARRVTVYAPGDLLVAADRAKHAFARMHVNAYAQQGNSGGALVDGEGELVGIIASGGEGRTEVVPIAAIADLRALSGPEHAARSAAIGRAYRDCDTALEAARRERGALPESVASALLEHCPASANRQLIDLAAQAFGARGDVDTSIRLFEQARARDPGAINTRLGLLTALHMAGRFADELPILRELLPLIPEDQMLQRFAIQAGKWGGDDALARQGLALAERHNPAQAEAARRFYESDIPPPRHPPRRR